jgi:hypothetical protein
MLGRISTLRATGCTFPAHHGFWSSSGAVCSFHTSRLTLMRINSLLLCFGITLCFFADAVVANPVLFWNGAFTAEMRRDTLAPPILARNLALLHSAVWEAHTKGRPPSEKVCHLISCKISSKLLPGHADVFEKLLDEHYPEKILDADRGVADECVWKTLLAAAADGASSHVTYTAKGKPGSWFRTPPFFRAAELPHWGKVKPFQIPSAYAFRPDGPPPISSPAYVAAWRETRDWGGKNSTLRTEDQGATAKFWADFSYTETPVGHWNRIARTISAERQLSQKESALLFHLLNAALADSAIACWDAKYAYDFWRPITAVRQADSDQNPETIADSNWDPFLITPNHPEYVSGHSTFSAAAASILSSFFGTGEIAFEVGSDTVKGESRRFACFDDCVMECSQSRIYGGIHFRFSCEDGIRLGRRVGEYIWEKNKALWAGMH